MKITVINGTEKHGVTYRMKEMFLESFKDNAEITEYRDQPHYLEPPGDIQYVINVYLRPEDPFEIERQLPPGHNRILRTTEIWA